MSSQHPGFTDISRQNGGLAAVLLPVSDWLERTAIAKLVTLLLSLMLVRSGIAFYGPVERMIACAQIFPKPDVHWRCQPLTVVSLPALFGIDTPAGWWHLYSALTLLLILGTVALARLRLGDTLGFRASVVWILLGSMPVVLLHELGSYDIYTIAGGSLWGLAGTWWLALAGGLLLGGASPEQAGVATLALFAVAAALGAWKWRPLYAGAAGVLISACSTKIYLRMHGIAGDDRAMQFKKHLFRSTRYSVQNGLTALYPAFGVAWLLIVVWLLLPGASRVRKGAMVAGLCVLPGLMALLTLDGTRVFLCCSWPAFLFFAAHVCDQREQRSGQLPIRTITALALVLALVLPAYDTKREWLQTSQLWETARYLWKAHR